MNPGVIEIRREICALNHCTAPCDFADPCARCPNGHWESYQRRGCEESRRLGLGDVVAAVATPIARVLGLPCIDPETKQLRPESGCGKRKAVLNQIHL